MTNEIHHSLSRLALSSETVWGETDAVPVWVHMPVMDYGVRFRPERRNAQPVIGLRQRKHGKNVKGMISGPLQASLYGQVDSGATISKAQYLLDWAFLNPENILTLPSKSAQWLEGPGVADKDHKGLRVNSATLSGSDQSGIIEVSLDLMGQSEAALASSESIPTDHEKLQEFEFCESTFTLAGAGVNLAAFQWQASNNLEVNYLGSFNPSLITAGPRVDTLQLTLVKNSATYDGYRRAAAMNEFTAVLKLRGLHNGTGTVATDYTVVTITFNRLQLADFEDQRSFETLTKSPLQLDVLKPDDANPAVSIVWSEEAAS